MNSEEDLLENDFSFGDVYAEMDSDIEEITEEYIADRESLNDFEYDDLYGDKFDDDFDETDYEDDLEEDSYAETEFGEFGAML